MNTFFKVLQGHWRDEQGLMEMGTMMVHSVDGAWYRAEFGPRDPIKAERYAVCDGLTGIEIEGVGGGFAFCPNEGECERIGMPIGEAHESLGEGS